ncbi:hypothetical protein SFC66_12530 [Terribacillus saccharophilus]|uniref:hypothetical protein n=1 Tax=Terribacillus saccharophilus TaxID=361277 RepID=UPI003981C693
MSWEMKRVIAVLFIALPLLTATFLCFKSELLIPNDSGGTDGYTVAKTLMIVFTLYLFTKIGFVIFKSTEKK